MLVPAYAATIHKSQGSEYPAVIIPVLTQHYAMLQRNLLYTGVTSWTKEGHRHCGAQRLGAAVVEAGRMAAPWLGELVSVSGKRIFAGRDKRARIAPKTNFAFERDKSRARNAANSGHSRVAIVLFLSHLYLIEELS